MKKDSKMATSGIETREMNKNRKGGRKVKNVQSKSEGIASVSIAQRLIAVVVLIAAYIYGREYLMKHYGSEVDTFAGVSELISKRSVFVDCSGDYGTQFKKCSPKKCGRFVMDSVVSKDEAKGLRELAEKGMSHGGGSGGATILDLHSGALSFGDKFINIYSLSAKEKEKIFTDQDFKLYRMVKNKIHKTVAREFKIDQRQLYLTKPTFFSRITSKQAVTIHDEYWHPHIDKVTYGSFYYTSLLYLSDNEKDFSGGRFVFVGKDGNSTIEPKVGRLSFFSSGSENEHFVEKVTDGTRFAITVSFTCDKKFAIQDPSGELK